MIIGFIADSHLRDMQYGSRKRGAVVASQFLAAVKILLQQGAKIILHGGDLFDTPRPSARQISVLANDCETLLRQFNAKMFVISGNHDYSNPPWIKALNSSFIQSADNEIVQIEGAAILGVPYGDIKEQLEKINNFAGTNFGNNKKIVLMHAAIETLGGFPGNSIRPDDLPAAQLDAILLGDIHTPQFQIIGQKCLIGYPGSTSLCSISEPEQKFAVIIDIAQSPPKFTKYKIPSTQVIKINFSELHNKKEEELNKNFNGIIILSYDQEKFPSAPEITAASFPEAIILRDPKTIFLNSETTARQNCLADFNEIAKAVAAGQEDVQEIILKLLAKPNDADKILEEFAGLNLNPIQ